MLNFVFKILKKKKKKQKKRQLKAEILTIIFFFLSGLAETYLHLEKEKLKIVFDGKAIECAQYVVHYISR